MSLATRISVNTCDRDDEAKRSEGRTVNIRRRARTIEAQSDVATVGAASGDDGDPFACLYRAHAPDVYRFCYVHLQDRAEAEDATSQTFLKALHAFARYRERGTSRSWLLSIAHNVVMDLHRNRLRSSSLDTSPVDLIDPAASPEASTIARFDLDLVERALAQLPATDREILDLRRAGLNGLEIASVLGIGHEAAKKRQLRALDRLEAVVTQSLTSEEVRRGA